LIEVLRGEMEHRKHLMWLMVDGKPSRDNLSKVGRTATKLNKVVSGFELEIKFIEWIERGSFSVD